MKLQDWREKHRLTQRALAGATGVSQSTIQRIEDGKPPTLEIACLLVWGAGGQVRFQDLVTDEIRTKRRGLRTRVRRAARKRVRVGS